VVFNNNVFLYEGENRVPIIFDEKNRTEALIKACEKSFEILNEYYEKNNIEYQKFPYHILLSLFSITVFDYRVNNPNVYILYSAAFKLYYELKLQNPHLDGTLMDNLTTFIDEYIDYFELLFLDDMDIENIRHKFHLEYISEKFSFRVGHMLKKEFCFNE
jgi:hypothetical protein